VIAEILATALVVIFLAGATALFSRSFPREMHRWIWIALGEYLLCATAQLLYSRVLVGGGDAYYYGEGGADLARAMDMSFRWAAEETLSLLLQQPSAFDTVVLGAGDNTGSMVAAGGFIVFLLRGSQIGAQVLVAGLSLFGALNIYRACREAYPEGSPVRLFTAIVLFPSIAFWTSALHKEAFCLIGTGALFAAWSSIRARRYFRVPFYVGIGLFLIIVFRAPALPPLLLGGVAFFVVDRIQKTRGAETTLLGPIYLALGVALLAGGMVALSRLRPELSLDRIGDAVAAKQRAWTVSGGGSSFDTDEPLALTPAQQLARAPLALVNALFRPQLFDVTNPLVLISALEMTAMSVLLVKAFRLHGFGGFFARVQRSPFMLMCFVITLVGCTFIGLVTLNFGTLARYRVPFLPFYGSLIAMLTERSSVPESEAPAVPRGAGVLPPHVANRPRRRRARSAAPT